MFHRSRRTTFFGTKSVRTISLRSLPLLIFIFSMPAFHSLNWFWRIECDHDLSRILISNLFCQPSSPSAGFRFIFQVGQLHALPVSFHESVTQPFHPRAEVISQLSLLVEAAFRKNHRFQAWILHCGEEPMH